MSCKRMLSILTMLLLVTAGTAGAALTPRVPGNAKLVDVPVTLGSAGSSGSSSCFPIRLSSRGRDQALLGNGFVRLVGEAIGIQSS